MRISTLFGKRGALSHTETVLLVHDNQPEPLYLDRLLYQRVSADKHLDPAAFGSLAHVLLFGSSHTARKQPDSNPERLQKARERVVMLTGKHLGRRHN